MEKKNKALVWGPLTIGVLVLLILISWKTPLTGTARNIINLGVRPVEQVVSFSYKKIKDLGDFLFGSSTMRKDYKKLVEENKKLKADLAKAEESLAKEDFLRADYELSKSRDFAYTEARLIARGVGNVFSNFKIDKGSKHGVKPGDIVLTGENFTKTVYKEALVGRVIEVGTNWSIVGPILSDGTAISFFNSRTLDEGIVKSHGADGLRAYNFDSPSQAKEGDKLMTSGMGENYPRGIYIGDITRINESDDYGSQLVVEPRVDFSKLYKLIVIHKDVNIDE